MQQVRFAVEGTVLVNNDTATCVLELTETAIDPISGRPAVKDTVFRLPRNFNIAQGDLSDVKNQPGVVMATSNVSPHTITVLRFEASAKRNGQYDNKGVDDIGIGLAVGRAFEKVAAYYAELAEEEAACPEDEQG